MFWSKFVHHCAKSKRKGKEAKFTVNTKSIMAKSKVHPTSDGKNCRIQS